MIHRTFRSLDEAPKLVWFTMGQWGALITATSALVGLVYLTHLPVKPAITLGVFVIGLPAALTYVSESGGLQIGALLSNMCGWRCRRQLLAAFDPCVREAHGIVLISAPKDPVGERAPETLVADHALDELFSGERWGQ